VSLAMAVAESAAVGALLLAVRVRRDSRPSPSKQGKKPKQSRGKTRKSNGEYHEKKAQRRSKFNEPGGGNKVLLSDSRCEEVTDAQHDGLQHYHNLKAAELQARDGLFIAEGPETIRMLLRSDVEIISLLLKPSIYEKIADDINRRPQRPRVLVCNASLMASVVGEMRAM
jgi:hypothetical protein